MIPLVQLVNVGNIPGFFWVMTLVTEEEGVKKNTMPSQDWQWFLRRNLTFPSVYESSQLNFEKHVNMTDYTYFSNLILSLNLGRN